MNISVMVYSFRTLFATGKAVIGMVHLAGRDLTEKVERAKEELIIYTEEGINGAIIEDYHGTPQDIELALWEYGKILRDSTLLGVNNLRNPSSSFEICQKYELGFIQLDNVNSSPGFDEFLHGKLREKHPSVYVLGGVRFKYQPPTGRTLEDDIKEGMSRCDAIVTTGEGTGIETPLQKLENFRKVMENFPLIADAGVTAENVREQLKIADGAIVGSYFKSGNTRAKVQRDLVRRLMDNVRSI